ncbi:MAG: hypothetical protein WCD18_14595, partial [Thermosynechococcaceae cyanobacterium]
EIRQKFLHHCNKAEIEWRQSYLSLDRTRGIHECYAPHTELIQDVQRQIGIPGDRIWFAQRLQP